ncbi:MAG: hypothetical protein IJD88_01110, partial [Clostridia bacterium]|nr:hypothetical protein [Clostridia bacterium]
MKMFFNDEDYLEKVIGGIFGVVAIVAAIVEIFIGGPTTGSVVAGIKDVAGTLIVVVLLVAFIKNNRPKAYKDFNSAFDAEMTVLCEKYSPVITKDENKENRY